MMGQKMMAFVDKRLRQATGQLDMPLGGVSVILLAILVNYPQLVTSYCTALQAMLT